MYVWKFSHDEHWCAIGVGVGAPPLDTQSPLVRTHLSFGLTNGETFLLELVRGESTQVKLEVFDHFTHITWMLYCNRQCFGRGDRYLGDGWWLFSDWRISFSWHLFEGWLAYVVWVIGWWWISSRLTYRWLQHLIIWRLFNVSSDYSWQFKSIQEVTTVNSLRSGAFEFTFKRLKGIGSCLIKFTANLTQYFVWYLLRMIIHQPGHVICVCIYIQVISIFVPTPKQLNLLGSKYKCHIP